MVGTGITAENLWDEFLEHDKIDIYVAAYTVPLTVGGNRHRHQKPIRSGPLIGYGINVIRDGDDAGVLATDRVKFKGVNHRIRDLTGGGYGNRLQESVISGAGIGHGIDIALNEKNVGLFSLVKVKNVVHRIGYDDRDGASDAIGSSHGEGCCGGCVRGG